MISWPFDRLLSASAGVTDGSADVTDLLTGTLAGKGTLAIGWFSAVSALTRVLMVDPLSVDIDLLTGGDGDLGFCPPFLSRAVGNLVFLCLPEEQLLA